MRSAQLIVTFPASFDNPAYVEVDASSSELAGIAPGTPVAVTLDEDVSPSSDVGDAVITARVVSEGVLRFRACAPPFEEAITLIVTELLP